MEVGGLKIHLKIHLHHPSRVPEELPCPSALPGDGQHPLDLPVVQQHTSTLPVHVQCLAALPVGSPCLVGSGHVSAIETDKLEAPPDPASEVAPCKLELRAG